MSRHADGFEAWMRGELSAVEAALARWVVQDEEPGLGQAIRYSVLDGGKRLRPLLARASAQALGGHESASLRAACAVELIHAYSLVHDDMPCMDNDVLRRGKPTVHVKFGQALALLSGDALQALAFEVLTPSGDEVPLSLQARLCGLLARASGPAGMAGGQAIDLCAVGQTISQARLQRMHRLKTGALLHASVMMGAACGEPAPAATQALSDYGWALGLAFQVVDDILDVTADSATLGKTAGKDAAADKPTFVSLIGLDASRAYAAQLHGQTQTALAALAPLLPSDGNTAHLRALADWVIERKS